MTVELRRFRTWQSETSSHAQPSWRILFRYQLRTMLKTWYTATPLVIVGVYLLIAFGGSLTAWTHPLYPETVTGSDITFGIISLSAIPALVFALLVGAPLFAEDLRYNAPLFYFSRPLRPGTYFQGKLFFLGGVLGAIAFVPFLALLCLGLIIRVPDQIPSDGYSALASGADAAHALLVVIPGMLVTLLWVTALTLVVSVHTRRTWHAAMGFAILTGAWSLLGGTASILADTAYKFVWGPTGWFKILFELPFNARYHERIQYTGPGGIPYTPPVPESYFNIAPATAIVYAIMLGTAVLGLWLTHRRLHRLEALL